ncbi:hypothetical protein PMAYCL1PPCAC_14105 [Pristionchus mayeri]|uniref:Uncharacterized protein n=1 Tax=Pristionchus mayeri TaxID=1317129 RepID=A0AAN5CFA2_9BILA|nr:hypothetical protein PMAYCL1PPCAC_14105 [Pristionchus mayeri]
MDGMRTSVKRNRRKIGRNATSLLEICSCASSDIMHVSIGRTMLFKLAELICRRSWTKIDHTNRWQLKTLSNWTEISDSMSISQEAFEASYEVFSAHNERCKLTRKREEGRDEYVERYGTFLLEKCREFVGDPPCFHCVGHAPDRCRFKPDVDEGRERKIKMTTPNWTRNPRYGQAAILIQAWWRGVLSRKRHHTQTELIRLKMGGYKQIMTQVMHGYMQVMHGLMSYRFP